MYSFNTKLVESLDFLNKVLAVIFVIMSVVKFVDMAGESILGAVYETLTVIGIGILTCGYIALMLNINRLLEKLARKH